MRTGNHPSPFCLCFLRVPAKETMQKRLTAVYNRVMSQVKGRLQASPYVAVAADCWEDKAHGEVLGITVLPFTRSGSLQPSPLLARICFPQANVNPCWLGSSTLMSGIRVRT